MDLPTLITGMTTRERDLMIQLLHLGGRHAAPSPDITLLITQISDASAVTPTLNRYHARILLMLFVAPRGLLLRGINDRVMASLYEHGRVAPAPQGRWIITRTAASVLYRGGYADELIAEAAGVSA